MQAMRSTIRIVMYTLIGRAVMKRTVIRAWDNIAVGKLSHLACVIGCAHITGIAGYIMMCCAMIIYAISM